MTPALPSQEAVISPDGITYRLIPLDWIVKNPDNYNGHPPVQTLGLKEDLKRFGQIKPYVVKQRDEQAFLLAAGEGCTIAAHELLAEDPQRFAALATAKVIVVPDWWTAEDVNGYLVADNETARLSVPDAGKLVALLEQQQQAGHLLLALGFDQDRLNATLEEAANQLLAADGEEEEDQEEDPQKGTALDLLDVTIGEPHHAVAAGQVYTLQAAGLPPHLLACVQPFAGWPTWLPLFRAQAEQDGAPLLFLPFAGPFAVLAEVALTHRLFLLQPDPYIAGHLLDRYAEVYPDVEIRPL